MGPGSNAAPAFEKSGPHDNQVVQLLRDYGVVRLFETVVKVVFSEFPRVVKVPTRATAIRAAMRPYSMAVAPAWFLRSFLKNARIMINLQLPVCDEAEYDLKM